MYPVNAFYTSKIEPLQLNNLEMGLKSWKVLRDIYMWILVLWAGLGKESVIL